MLTDCVVYSLQYPLLHLNVVHGGARSKFNLDTETWVNLFLTIRWKFMRCRPGHTYLWNISTEYASICMCWLMSKTPGQEKHWRTINPAISFTNHCKPHRAEHDYNIHMSSFTYAAVGIRSQHSGIKTNRPIWSITRCLPLAFPLPFLCRFLEIRNKHCSSRSVGAYVIHFFDISVTCANVRNGNAFRSN